MDRSTACTVLGVTPDALGPLTHNYRTRRADVEERLAAAPTESLREKLRRHLDELDAAYEVLAAPPEPTAGATAGLSVTQIADLPDSNPFYTGESSPTSAAPGARVGLSAGQILCERYEIRELIGAGGMGAVYAAFDRNRDKEIAIKVLLPSLTKDDRARERFLNEARLSSELSHPGIVNVFDVQNDGPLYFLTMEKLEGVDLRRKLTVMKERGQTLPVDESIRIGTALCEALTYAHDKGAVHRDVKPENVFLCDDATVKLMDFGIARLMRTSQMTMTGTSMGTAYYMAPEQLDAAREVDGRADQYAVGAVLYEMLTGSPPSGRFESAKECNGEVSPSLSDAVDHALNGKPEQRFSSIADLASRLHKTDRRHRLKPARAASNRPLSHSTSPSPNRRKRTLVVTVGVLALVTAGVTFSRWASPISSAMRTMTRDSSAQQRAETARDEASTARDALHHTLAILPEALARPATAEADRLYAAGESSLDEYADAQARKSFDEAQERYAAISAKLAGDLQALVADRRAAFDVQLGRWRGIRAADTKKLDQLNIEIDRSDDRLRTDRLSDKEREHELQLKLENEMLRAHLERVIVVASAHVYSDEIEMDVARAEERAKQKSRSAPAEAIAEFDEWQEKLERFLNLHATLGAAVEAEFAANLAKRSYEVVRDREKLTHESSTAREASSEIAGAQRSLDSGEADEARRGYSESAVAYKRAQDMVQPTAVAIRMATAAKQEYESELTRSGFESAPRSGIDGQKRFARAEQFLHAGDHSAAADEFVAAEDAFVQARSQTTEAARVAREAAEARDQLAEQVAISGLDSGSPAAARGDTLLSAALEAVAGNEYARAIEAFSNARIEFERVRDVVVQVIAAHRVTKAAQATLASTLDASSFDASPAATPAIQQEIANARNMFAKSQFALSIDAFRTATELLKAAELDVSEAADAFAAAKNAKDRIEKVLTVIGGKDRQTNGLDELATASSLSKAGSYAESAPRYLAAAKMFQRGRGQLLVEFVASDLLSKYRLIGIGTEGTAQTLDRLFGLNLNDAVVLQEIGTPDASYVLGSMYFYGCAVGQNDLTAVRWHREAAERGHAAGQSALAAMYQEGRGVPRDDTEAVRWYRKAADQGHAPAQNNLGWMYQKGHGVARDDTEAVRWYRKAADQGIATAQDNLGWMYEEGRGVPRDDTEAVRWYRKAADQGHASAQNHLGWMYVKGRGVARDDTEAVRWYRTAADQGQASAQNNLGWMYQEGRGVPRDDTEAVRWYRKAADQGRASAQNNLGWMYQEGRGVPRDDTEAVRWYRKAADQGSAAAQINLGWMYEEGRGVARDDTEAVRLYRKAADQGHASAQWNLGLMYTEGRGVTKNKREAIRWLRKAAEQGHEQAKRKLRELD